MTWEIPKHVNLHWWLFAIPIFRLSEYEKGGRDATEFLRWQESARKVLN